MFILKNTETAFIFDIFQTRACQLKKIVLYIFYEKFILCIDWLSEDVRSLLAPKLAKSNLAMKLRKALSKISNKYIKHAYPKTEKVGFVLH